MNLPYFTAKSPTSSDQSLDSRVSERITHAIQDAKTKHQESQKNLKEEEKSNLIKADELTCSTVAQQLIDLAINEEKIYLHNCQMDKNFKAKNSENPSFLIAIKLNDMLRKVDSHFSRLVIFQIIDGIIMTGSKSKLFEEVMGKLHWYCVRLRSSEISSAVSDIFDKWRKTNYVDDSLIEELNLIVFHNQQPDESISGFIKFIKKDFDSLRFLRILGKMKELEAKLDTQGRALKTMPVQSDAEDIEMARKTFVGGLDLFKHHFEEHRKKLDDHLKSLQKYMTYHEEIANGFPDAIRYFHALYKDSTAVCDAYAKFDIKVDKQIIKLFSKVSQLKLDKTLEHVIALHQQTSKKKSSLGQTQTVFKMDTPMSPGKEDKGKLKDRELSTDEKAMLKSLKEQAKESKTLTDMVRKAKSNAAKPERKREKSTNSTSSKRSKKSEIEEEAPKTEEKKTEEESVSAEIKLDKKSVEYEPSSPSEEGDDDDEELKDVEEAEEQQIKMASEASEAEDDDAEEDKKSASVSGLSSENENHENEQVTADQMRSISALFSEGAINKEDGRIAQKSEKSSPEVSGVAEINFRLGNDGKLGL